MPLGGIDEGRRQFRQRGAIIACRIAREQRHVGRDLIVARPRRVQRAADGADELGQTPLDRHVDVLVIVRERERRRLQLDLDGFEASISASRSRSEITPCAASMRACARDWAMSWRQSRWSNPSDVLSAQKCSC